MNKNNYKLVVYFIGITIALTIAVQVYWNIREYQINKKNLIGKVQTSLDKAVEDYYANLTRTGIVKLSPIDSSAANIKIDSFFFETKSRKGLRIKIDSTLEDITLKDSGKLVILDGWRTRNPNFINKRYFRKNIDSIIHKVIVSFSRDSLDLARLNTNIQDEFNRNNLNVMYAIKFDHHHFVERDSLIEKTTHYNFENFPNKYLTTTSKSNYLPYRSKLELLFTNETSTVLRDSLVSILLSFLLSVSIIFSLVYLLKTIYKQKQLAEIKNDLISNITHEFKTPIATISTALEAMKSFNALNDKEKSEKYINIANSQVNKLGVMVEKILETATLNQEELELQKEPVLINDLLKSIIEKFEIINTENEFVFKSSIDDSMTLLLDKFHMENALGNIIDNAIKYGGNKIIVKIHKDNNKVILQIKDNGNGIHKSQKEKVFEQFYRIPTGNTHNVKGFGIGLYYTKSIIAKHGGTINIVYDKKENTSFKIELTDD